LYLSVVKYEVCLLINLVLKVLDFSDKLKKQCGFIDAIKSMSLKKKDICKGIITLTAALVFGLFFEIQVFSQISPVISFNEHPYNHNMHITSDGTFFYTINGGNASSGKVNKFDLSGNLIQTYPIQIDGRGLSYNQADGFLYVSTYMGNIVRITDLATGAFTVVLSGVMQNDQCSFALSPDGTKFYDFYQGTLRIHSLATGAVIGTLTGLSYGPGSPQAGDAAVAVDANNLIYTWNANAKTVYVYTQSGVLMQTMVLNSGSYGFSLSIVNCYLFVSLDGNYSSGTWYGYNISCCPTANISYSGSPWCTTATNQTVTLTGTGNYTGGTYTASPAGLTINSATGMITPATCLPGTYTVTYTIPAVSGCASVTATTQVTVTVLPTANISYSGSPYCITATTQPVTLTGTGNYTGGTYTASSAGLTINSSTGMVSPATSLPGTYTVTYSIPAVSGCASVTATTQVTVTALPTANISYSGSPYCTTATTQPVTLTGAGNYTGGTYTASPAGLTINSTTGLISPGTSVPGTYTVTYSIPASGGCPALSATTQVTITALPIATISYTGLPWCTTATTQPVTLTGTGNYTGGTYTASPAGLTIGSSTGLITPVNSLPGTYTITYTIPATAGCVSVIATTQVIITAMPTATISYSGSPWCTTGTDQAVTLTGTGSFTGGTYTASPAGLTINSTTGLITPGPSVAGTYSVTYVKPASGGCAAVTATTTVTITAFITATIAYTGSVWCTSAGPQAVILNGSGAYTGGTFSAFPAGLTINPSTGLISPGTSSAGTYTVSYALPATGGCTAVNANTPVTIVSLPTANISYTGSPWCASSASQAVTMTGTGTYTGGTFSATPPGLTINAASGEITPATSNAGTYTVNYVISASGGCAAVNVSAQVTVSPSPAVTAVAFPALICAGESTMLTASGADTYSWIPGFLDGATVTVTPAVSTLYTITGTSLDGCTGSASVSVTVNSIPVLTTNADPADICEGNASALTAAGAATYIWMPGNINGETITVTPTSSTIYTVIGSNPGGCSDTTTVSVSIQVVPEITILSSPDEGCVPLEVSFVYGPGFQIDTNSLLWNFDDVLSANNSATSTNPEHVFITEGLYRVQLEAWTTAGCYVSSADTVNAIARPVADFYFYPDYAYIDDPRIDFHDRSSGVVLWRWDFGDSACVNSNTSSLVNPVHIFSDTGNFMVQLVVESGKSCSDTLIRNISIFLNDLVFMPNAFTPNGDGENDRFKPIISGIDKDAYKFMIFNRNGKEVFSTRDCKEGWTGFVNGKSAIEDVYVYIVEYKEIRGVVKVIKGVITLLR